MTETSPEDEYVGREAALELLSIKPQTLYAYVSRVWVRSIRKPVGGRASLYSKNDIEKLIVRQTARSGHGPAAASAMRWGAPIIPTSITAITAHGPRYRGHLATDLARRRITFEAVAGLLWAGTLFDEQCRWPVLAVPKEVTEVTTRLRNHAFREGILETFAIVCLHLGISRGTAAQRLAAPTPTEAGRQLLQIMTGCMGLLGPRRAFSPMKKGESIAEALLRVMDVPQSAENVDALQAILVLYADHELSSGAFAARIAASSGTPLHGCVAAAIATHSGVTIDGQYDRIALFTAPRLALGEMLARARELQSTGVTVPGFNHPLYPRGDHRADHLLGMVAARSRKTAHSQNLLRFVDTVQTKMKYQPRAELAIVALASAMRLPAKAPSAITTLARMAGWIAHVIEQRSAGFLLRPRAKYVTPTNAVASAATYNTE